MNKHLLFFASLFLFLVSECLLGQEKSDIIKMLPESGQIKDWHFKDSISVFNGENLFSLIDGGADIYLEYGFDKVGSCKYINPASNYIHAEIYQMTSDSAAFGIFSINSSGKGNSIALGDKAWIYDYYLDFWKGQYFVRCTAGNKGGGIMDTLQMFAFFIDGKIAGNGKAPLLTNVFTNDITEFHHLKYFTGIIGLGNVYNFGHGAIAGFSEGVAGYSEGRMLMVISYTDSHKAREWFASAKGKMQMNKKYLDYALRENGFTIKDKAGINFCFVSHSRFMIILKGMEWEEAQPLLEQIRKNLH